MEDKNGSLSLAQILEQKKRALLGGTVNEEGGINLKKLSKEEKEKIKRALKKKKQKLKKKLGGEEDSEDEQEIKLKACPKPEIDPEIEVEYVEKDEYLLTGKNYDEFKHVFQYFAAAKQPVSKKEEKKEDEEERDEEQQLEEKPLSRKKRKE